MKRTLTEQQKKTLSVLAKAGIKLLLMRCAGYNNVDLTAAKANGITVMSEEGKPAGCLTFIKA